MGYKSFTDGGSVTDTSTTQEVDLGTLQVVDGDSGPATYVYVYNDDAAVNWAVGEVIAREVPGSATHAATKGMAFDGQQSDADASRASDVLGVAQSAINAGEYGWILARGVGTVKCEASVAVATALATDGGTAAGTAEAATSGELDAGKGIGIALTAHSGGTCTALITLM